MKNRFIGLFLAIIMLFGMSSVVYGATDEAVNAADTLNALGLFGGTGTDENGNPIYALDKESTRQEAVTMLVQVLGKGEEAKNGTWDMPFTDVAEWAKPYVGYAYANGIASGISDTAFGGSDKITATQYITYMLRAIGYEVGVDFQWDKAWELSDKIGMTDGRYNENTAAFLRSDMVIVSAATLNTELKDSDDTLFKNMKKNGSISMDTALGVNSQELKYEYSFKSSAKGTTEYPEDNYVESAFVTKIGDRYQFELKLMPDFFVCFEVFPASYKALNNRDNHPDGYSREVLMNLDDTENTVVFSLSEEFIFENPIDTDRLVFKLVPIERNHPNDRIALWVDTEFLPE